MKKIIITIIIVLALGAGWYLISPVFISEELDEALPENIIEPEPLAEDEVAVPDKMASGLEKLSVELQEQFAQEMEKANQEEPKMMDEAMVEVMVQGERVGEAEAVVEPKSSPVIGTRGHRASGVVKVLNTTDGPVIRYENFDTINGPNLHVYLSRDLEASEFYDLGKAKGTRGNINYPVPKEVDLSQYRYVMYWCVPFSVLFNYAEIN